MGGITTDRHGWMVGERRTRASEEPSTRREDGRPRGWAYRVVDAWWRGWVAFTRVTGEPYLPLGGRDEPDPVMGKDHEKPVEKDAEERCA